VEEKSPINNLLIPGSELFTLSLFFDDNLFLAFAGNGAHRIGSLTGMRDTKQDHRRED
jgi:hypothetical protein